VTPLATLVVLVLKASIFLTVLALGLRSSVDDALYLFRRPGRFARSLLAMDVVMPVAAVAMAAAFDLHPPVKIALIALAVSPVPPILPRKQLKGGGHGSYVVGLLFAAALSAIAFAPAAFNLIARVFGTTGYVTVATIVKIVAATVLVPLLAGVIIRRAAPDFARQAVRVVSTLATVLLVLSAVPLLAMTFPAMMSLVGNGTLLAIVVFVVIGLAAGHLLGGPDFDTRGTLALATASRHPGVALGIGLAAFPGQKLVIAAVFMYLLVNALVSIPYLAWYKHRQAHA
jgi:BASS family bile acid:Na+ symporter